MSNPKIAKVAVPGPFLFPLDYLLEPEADLLTTEEPSAVIGGRVWVPFRNKKVVGLVIDISESADFEISKIKPIREVIDREPLFSKTQLGLFNWASQYYHEPIGDVIMTALPKR